jgi:beta-lactamase regulating signal transducer with metallopeptidase domain
VKRNDWFMTLIEELTAALLWFQPTVWLLRSQIRLAREQVVDAEVIRRTSARESYIGALLAIAGAWSASEMKAAPSFLRRRHLG